MKAKDTACRLPIETPQGTFEATYTERGLAGLRFPPHAPLRRERNSPAPKTDLCPAASPVSPPPRWRQLASRGVLAILRGKAPAVMPPLDLTAGTAFQQAVWEQLRAIPPGQTCTYAAIAMALGRPGAARAVGQACGANPVPLLIPCHRVVAAHGRLGGFSGGPGWKPWLLAREGVALPPDAAGPYRGRRRASHEETNAGAECVRRSGTRRSGSLPG